MRPTHLVVAAAALVASACTDLTRSPVEEDRTAGRTAEGLAPLVRPARNAVPGRYIVLLEKPAPGRNPLDHISAVAASAGVRAQRTYDRLNGFAAQLTENQLAALRRNPSVRFVEQDQAGRLSTTQTFTTLSLWGLDRIDELSRPLSGSYTYDNTGSGVKVYVIDSGIQLNHSEFGGRAKKGYDAFRSTSDPLYSQDCYGHGTNVAGVVGATKWGVAKQATLYAVRIGECSNTVWLTDVIDGINWVIANHTQPAVANISSTFAYSSTLNWAVEDLVNAGVFTAVAAGNGPNNACNVSPASEPKAFTTAASDSLDVWAGFSNYGGCVDAYAPGKFIGSADYSASSTTAAQANSGTSLAAPFVAGVAALYLQGSPSATPLATTNWIISNASPGKITSNPVGTPNLLLNKKAL